MKPRQVARVVLVALWISAFVGATSAQETTDRNHAVWITSDVSDNTYHAHAQCPVAAKAARSERIPISGLLTQRTPCPICSAPKLVASLSPAPTAAVALSPDAVMANLRICAKDTSESIRLLCYDSLAREAGAAPGVTSSTATTTTTSPTSLYGGSSSGGSTTSSSSGSSSTSSSSSSSGRSGRCWVNGYTTKKGKSVGGYWRKC